MSRDAHRAKAVICELIRRSGGEFESNTRLFNAFWRAHVHYLLGHVSPLTKWDIVRLPFGPGIDAFDSLLSQLLAEGSLTVSDCTSGGLKFALTDECGRHEFSADEAAAIEAGVSQNSHIDSRSWQLGSNGDVLDLMLDAMTEEEWSEAGNRLQAAREVLLSVDRLQRGGGRTEGVT